MAAQAHEIQGSQEWLEYRRTRGGASEVAALFGESPFMPKTAAELYEVKTGEREVFVNDAMRHGSDHEDAARAKIEDEAGEPFEPQVLEDSANPRIVASLDGQSFGGDLIVEIKCPPKGRESKAWKHVEENGKPPRNYWLQCQQQLMVAEANRCLFAVYDAGSDDVITTEVAADPATHKQIRERWAEFFNALDAGEKPDNGERDDAEWREAAEAYRVAKEALTEAQEAEKAAKARLEELAGYDGAKGCGVKVTRYQVAGSIDYKKAVPEDIDLEQYRKPGRWQTRVTLE